MLIQADARQIPLVDGCVQCVVTSPPYFGLRDYGTGTWRGGDPACSHLRVNDTREGVKQTSNRGTVALGFCGICGICGAERVDAQIGLEPTPDAFTQTLVQVFRELRRILADDGVCWLNLGDSYSQSSNTGGTASIQGTAKRVGAMNDFKRDVIGKPKDLLGIPWRVAFALQADGWYLRSDVIWHKPNPMPESVTDRPTKAHEYLFLLTKSERYYYDAPAIAEPTEGRERFGNSRVLTHEDRNDCERQDMTENWTRNKRSVWTIPTMPYTTRPQVLVDKSYAVTDRNSRNNLTRPIMETQYTQAWLAGIQ